jgi:O-antigen/teichoic acid export membrane protein
MTYITTLLKGQYPELLLILALILIPMVILIAVFGDEIVKKAKAQWDAVVGKEVKQPT